MSAFQVYEIVDSESGSVTLEQGANVVRELRKRFVAGQFDTFDACFSAMQQYAPQYLNSDFGYYYIRQSFTAQGVGNKYYDITATYRTFLQATDENGGGGGGDGGGGGGGGQSEITPGSVAFDTTGATKHITEAISTIEYPGVFVIGGEGKEPPIYGDAINVSGDGVAGIDIVAPSMRYSETWVFPTALALSEVFLQQVYQNTGSLNLEQFRVFEKGECLFLGARAQVQDNAPFVAVTFEFEARPNETQWKPWATTPGMGSGVTKGGWDYVWIEYENDEQADTLIKKPLRAFRHGVYKERPWTGMFFPEQFIGARRRGRLSQRGTEPQDPFNF